ncbi:TetR family transcriptional regulator [Chryseobacterium mucoviscidosis]|nr:TetR family transcriptional regulator [Chryseobacterium mucoviscidosis]
MNETKTDPRILRTRKLIMDSFIQLAKEKDFKDITINDITTKATVNRATFYYHFKDKYDLLEKVVKEEMMGNVINEIAAHHELNRKTIISVFLSLIKLQTSLSTQCRKSYETFLNTIEVIIKEELEIIFYQLLLKHHSTVSDQSLRSTAVMLSWGIYGVSVNWQQNSTLTPEEYIKSAIPFISHGMEFLVSEK